MRPKSGLHKKISSIFDGVPVPGRGSTDSNSPLHATDGTVNSGVSNSSQGTASREGKRPRMGKMVLIGVLALVLVVVLGMVLMPPASSSALDKKACDDNVETPSKKAADAIAWPVPEPYPTGLRDPMAIVVVEKTEVIPEEKTQQILFVIRGVVLGDRGNTAIVGSEIVSVGDTTQGAKVIRIDRNEVEFEKEGQRWVQTVNP